MRFRLGFVALSLALTLAFTTIGSTPVHADNLYAKIRGTVVDPSGAVVPGAKVTATNQGTGLSYTDTSSKEGLFEFLQLPIGDYTVRAEKSGFKTFAAANIHLDLDQVFNLKATMELGTTSETVTVEANPSQVETTSMQLGAVVSGNQIVDIPLNGRNWTQLMQLQPGVMASSDRFGVGAYSTNGSETQQNSFLINGTDSNDTSLNTPLVVPSPDAIGEFSMVTSTLNPEYGRNSGAIVNAAIKNGTNQFHGDVFEFYRDTFLDAKSWFESTAAPFHQNQFGGTIGGPIIKDHTFFFFSYQGTRNVVPEGYTAPTVFSSAERTGNFSADATLPNSTNPIPFAMYGDSASPCPVGGAMCQPGGATPLTYANLFSTGVIPAQDLNPLALKLMNQYVPLPNAANDLYQFNPTDSGKTDQYLGRIDEKITDRDALWFYGLYQNHPDIESLPFTGATVPGFTETNQRHTYQDTVSWTHTFSPTTLNEARFGYLRFNFVAVDPQQTINPASYGFTGISSNQAPQYQQLPIMSVTGYFELGFSSNGPQPRIQNTYQFVDNFSKVVGRHTLKFGFNMDRLEINNPFYNNLNGNFAYNGSGLFTTGNPGADFLLGVPDSYTQGSGSIIRARGREYYSYGQDQWQVRPNLTLTMGLAWDIETPYKNLYDGGEVMSNYIAGEQSTVFPTAPLGVVFPGDRGMTIYGGPHIDYKSLAPRFGFAWSPGDLHNLSIRGGIGIYYNRYEEETTLQTLANPPFSLTTNGAGQFGAPSGFVNPYISQNTAAITTSSGTVPVVASGSSPFPFSPPKPGSSVNFAPFEPLGFNMNVESFNMEPPRTTNFNFNVQYQVSKSMVAQIGYVGSIGRHLLGAYNLNPAGQFPGINPAAVAMGCISDFFLDDCTGGGTFQLGGFTSALGQPGIQATDYSSNYNSLQASLQRHMSNGLQLGVAYTWSRYFDYTSSLENSSFNGPGINNFSVAQNYGPSANDAPQRLVLNFVYTLPFYRFGHHFRPLTDGWNITGIGTFQSGFPVEVYSLGYNDLQWSYPDAYYANPAHGQLTGEPLQVNHNPRNNTIGGLQNYWLNPNAFTIAPNGTTGNANRNPFYGPGLNFWDLALEKDIHITEAKYFELRLETFNTFNHAQFAAPDGYVGDPNFGRVLGVQQATTNGDGRVVQLGAKIYF
jgi:hypothetical protein